MAGSKNQGQSNTQKSQGATKNEPVKPAATKDNKPTSSDTAKPPSSAASAIRKELQQQQKKFSELEKKTGSPEPEKGRSREQAISSRHLLQRYGIQENRNQL